MHVGLNKGEAKNALAKAVFFNRLGEMRDRSFENQRYRASGLNLVGCQCLSYPRHQYGASDEEERAVPERQGWAKGRPK